LVVTAATILNIKPEDLPVHLINAVATVLNRHQFPLQNAFALTVHKTQSLTLPEVSLNLDQQIFSAGQAYVALS